MGQLEIRPEGGRHCWVVNWRRGGGACRHWEKRKENTVGRRPGGSKEKSSSRERGGRGPHSANTPRYNISPGPLSLPRNDHGHYCFPYSEAPAVDHVRFPTRSRPGYCPPPPWRCCARSGEMQPEEMRVALRLARPNAVQIEREVKLRAI